MESFLPEAERTASCRRKDRFLRDRLTFLLACFTSGALWSISYLGVIELIHQATTASTALLLAWPIKIGWSTAHTMISRWRGAKSVQLTVAIA